MNKIGLCMIVKNESNVIERCLHSVKPLIDYVCISDTGSTDDTVNIIKKWLHKNQINGEVNQEQWENFAYNRTKSLENIKKNKDIDYVLVIDADEILEIDKNFDVLNFKKNLKHDLYSITCKFGNILYDRSSFFKNIKNFYYRGVLHEYLNCDESFSKSKINGIINIPLQDSSRNKNNQKYKNDAEVLKKAFETEKDNFLKTRYAFYLAQSYRDCNEENEAIFWYKKRSEMGGWDQEIYWSLYQLAILKEKIKTDENDIIQSYINAYEKCPSRIEALHHAIRFCRSHNKNNQAYIIGKYAKSLPVNKNGLFVEDWIWEYGLDDEFSVACYWSGHYEEGLLCCEQLLTKIPDASKDRILKNIEFFKLKLTL
jgi:hypothetical protein